MKNVMNGGGRAFFVSLICAVLIIAAILGIYSMCFSWIQGKKEIAVQASLSRGSNGEAVRTLQTSLFELGYYSGEIDGIFGSKTEEAVRRYQADRGLSADGIAGNATLSSLGIASSGGSGALQGYDSDTLLLARLINAEARGEDYLGQIAVGAVVLNRVKHSSFPNTISDVIYQSGAFSSVVNGQIWVKLEDSCLRAAQDAQNGVDHTYGAIYFYNPKKTNSAWMHSRETIVTIGAHVFAK